MAMGTPVRVSVVIPAYNEEGNVATLLEKNVEVLENQKIKYEIILVDDGSTDNTFSIVEKLARKMVI